MSRLGREIQACMSPPVETPDGAYVASFRFPADFSGFKGHFPGHPVLPGACMVQAAVVQAGSRRRGTVRLARVVSARWIAPVTPDMEVQFTCRERPGDSGDLAVDVSIAAGDRPMASLDLRLVAVADHP